MRPPTARRATRWAGRILHALLYSALASAEETFTLSGLVRDVSGAAVEGAALTLLDPSRTPVRAAVTDAGGRFSIAGLAPGRYVLIVGAPGGERQERAVVVGRGSPADLAVTVPPPGVTEHVIVSATPGVPQDAGSTPTAVNVVDEEELGRRAKSVLAQAAGEEPGLHLQRTSPTIGSIVVRGFTGSKVNAFVDGVRYSHSAGRGGISTFFNLLDPESLDEIEVLRGPSSTQYGSDAIGGSVQLMTRAPALTTEGRRLEGRVVTQAGSADQSLGLSYTGSYATPRFGLVGTVSGRRVEDVRPGEGIDSHNAVTRFFGLPSDAVIGDRLPDTSFYQYGGAVRFVWSPSPASQLAGAYLHGQQERGTRYDQLLGGDGNLVADLDHLVADLAYVRYERVLSGWFDRLSAGYSFNTQREERVNQGGNGDPLAPITHEPERTSAHGLQGLLTKFTARHALSIGGDVYVEGVDAPSYSVDPSTGATSIRRGRVPDGAAYRQGGLFVQDTFEAVPGRLQVEGSVRWSGARYRAEASDSPPVGGAPLWPDDDLGVAKITWRARAIGTVARGVRVVGGISTGFRAPGITDLGTLGLTGSGFEVAASDVEGLGATVGTTAGADAVSTGEPVRQVDPETSVSYEAGVHVRLGIVEAEIRGSIVNLDDTIAKQALILPPGAAGMTLGDETITDQNANGVVFVAASNNPVLVRTNFGRARVTGIEISLSLDLSPDVRVSTVATSLRAEDRDTGEPPNLEGGTPPPEAYLFLRYAPRGRRFWIEPYVHAASPQRRLSSLDLSDRRTGATRSASSIAAFFDNGARARGLIGPGADGVPETSDDVLIPTGETLPQVQQRVLGPALSPSPLFPEIPGYAVFGIRGGVTLGAGAILVDLENLGDENYRGPSWGMDAPGRGLFARYVTRF